MTIGTVVRVTHRLVREAEPCGQRQVRMTWEPLPLEPSRLGVITGRTFRMNGLRDPGYSHSAGPWGEGDYEPPFFIQEKRVPVWLVRFALTGAEVVVGDAHVTPVDVMDGWTLPNR